MDRVLIRIAILIAIVFMVLVSGGILWMFFGDCDEIAMQISCPRCGTEFKIDIP